MIRRMHMFIVVTGAACALQACGVEGPEDAERQTPTSGELALSEDGVFQQPVVPEPPAVIVDKRGQRWLRKHAVVPVPDAPFAPPARSAAAAKPDFLAMSDEELAEKIRPISLYQGHEYSLEKPPIEQARRLKAELRRQALGIRDPGRRGEPSERTAGVAQEEQELKEQLQAQQIVMGTDSRQQRRDNTAYPWRSIMLFTGINTGPAGTAQLIGPSTAVSVAHVFHSGSGWYSTRRWAAGVDSQDTNPYPFGRYDGCYWVTIPAAWDGDGIHYDFAVIEFSDMYPTCNLYPGNTVGWMGWWSGYVPSDSEFGYVYGYPGDPCPGGSCNWPQIWGIGANGMDEDGDNVDHYADTTGGQSGAGLYVIRDGTRYVIGTHKGGYTNPFDEWNEARRLEGLFYTFMKDYTAL